MRFKLLKFLTSASLICSVNLVIAKVPAHQLNSLKSRSKLTKVATSAPTFAKLTAEKSALGASIAPPGTCVGVTSSCTIGIDVPAAQQCCPGYTCDSHDNTCRITNGANCVPTIGNCVYGSICSANGQTNQMTVCQPCGPLNANCLVNSDCCQASNSSSPNQSCQFGTCHKCLEGGGTCGDNSVCCDGFVCLGSLGHRTCVACIGPDSAVQCTNSAQCCPGYTCQGGKCLACQDIGGQCANNANCCSDQYQLFCNTSGQCQNCLDGGNQCAESSQCCQGGTSSQACLSSACTTCNLFCGSCGAGNPPCCDGYNCIDQADFKSTVGSAASTCTGTNCYCCSQLNMPCNSSTTIISGPTNSCQNNVPGSSGCCPGLICSSATNLCANCVSNGGVCLSNSDCCTNGANLVCLPVAGTSYATCQTAAFCDALNGKYNAGIMHLYQNFQYYNLLPPDPSQATTPGPCTAAFWSYLYHINLLALYQWAISQTYADMNCQTGVIQQIMAKMENALRIMEAVCYDNSALTAAFSTKGAAQTQCGMPPSDASSLYCAATVSGPTAGQTMAEYLATLPQCLNVTGLLYNFVLAKACANTAWQTPAVQAAFTAATAAWSVQNTQFTTPLNYTQLSATQSPYFPTISSLPGGVAPAIFSAQDVIDLLSVGCYPSNTLCDNAILVPLENIPSNNQNITNNPRLKQLANSSNQVELVQFLSNVVDGSLTPLQSTLFYSNWEDPQTLLPTTCSCWDGHPASYQPHITGCVCIDSSQTCACDLKPTGDSGSGGSQSNFTIIPYYDGSGCEGACWDGPCSCTTTPYTTCAAEFGGQPACPPDPQTPCKCADNSTCSCAGTVASGSTQLVDDTTGVCTITSNCACMATVEGIGQVWLPLDTNCTVVNAYDDVSGSNSCSALANGQYQCAVYTGRGTENGACACCSKNTAGSFFTNNPADSTTGCCTNANTNFATLIPNFNPKRNGKPNFVAKSQSKCVCGDDHTPCIQKAPLTCTPACQTAQFGCCYDGSSTNPNTEAISNPDCINNLCCLDTVNEVIAENAQLIADNLNAVLFLINADGVAAGQVPGDYTNAPCKLPKWIFTVESELITNASGTGCLQALNCMNPAQCNILAKCTTDADCPNCACDLTTGYCTPCVPLGNGCVGTPEVQECCGADYSVCTNNICVNKPS